MINSTVLVGRLTKELDLRYIENGSAVASFTLAVNRQFKSAGGEREADFINCVIWNKSAENLANFTHKGSLIGITGRVQTRSYDNKEDGNRVYVTEIVIGSFSLLESQKSQNTQSENRPNPYRSDERQETQMNQQQNNVQQGNTAGGYNDSPDPF